MKVLTLLTCLGLLVVQFANGQTAKIEPDNRTIKASTRLRLVVDLEPSNARVGEQISMRLRLTNLTSQKVRLDESLPEFDFDFTVTDASGKDLPLTEFGNKKIRRDVFPISRKVLVLDPGQEVQNSVEVTRFYQFTQPGAYYVRVSRGSVWAESDEDNKKFWEVVYSDVVQFMIVP